MAKNAESLGGFGHCDSRPLKTELVDLKQYGIVSQAPDSADIAFKILEAYGLVCLSKKRAVASNGDLRVVYRHDDAALVVYLIITMQFSLQQLVVLFLPNETRADFQYR